MLALCAFTASCASSPVWRSVSPDRGTRVAVREVRGQSCVTIGSKAPRCHDAISLAGVAFAARGGSVAYPALVDGRWVVVHDGNAGPSWDGVGVPVLSTEGNHVAYPGLDQAGWHLVIDDRSGPAFAAIIAGSIVLDSTGNHHGYVIRRGDSAYVVIDGVASRGWSRASRPILAADATHTAYVARLGTPAMLVTDGHAGPPHDSIGDVVYSPRASTWAYAARDAGIWSVGGDEARLAPFAEVRELSWPPSRTTSHPAFIGRTAEGDAVIMDGVAPLWHARVSSLAFARVGPRWGYVANDEAVYVDGALRATELAAADLVISDDGSRVAWAAERGDSTDVVADDKRHTFDLVIPATLQFLPGRPTWVCLAGDRKRRALFVVVDGRRTDRAFDWEEIVRISQRADAVGTLRARVAAEALVALAAARNSR
ncbi:MAG: hypothetical protein ABIZ36_03585 [Gemmatimonadaceae bacterium]